MLPWIFVDNLPFPFLLLHSIINAHSSLARWHEKEHLPDVLDIGSQKTPYHSLAMLAVASGDKFKTAGGHRCLECLEEDKPAPGSVFPDTMILQKYFEAPALSGHLYVRMDGLFRSLSQKGYRTQSKNKCSQTVWVC